VEIKDESSTSNEIKGLKILQIYLHNEIK
jgi:hypothetical protein